MRKVKIVSVVCLEIAYLFAVGLVLIANVPMGKANDKLRVNGTVVPTVTYYDDGVTVLWQTDQPLTDKPTDDAAFISRVATILRAKYAVDVFSFRSMGSNNNIKQAITGSSEDRIIKSERCYKNDGGIGAVFIAEDIETAGVVSFVSIYLHQ